MPGSHNSQSSLSSSSSLAISPDTDHGKKPDISSTVVEERSLQDGSQTNEYSPNGNKEVNDVAPTQDIDGADDTNGSDSKQENQLDSNICGQGSSVLETGEEAPSQSQDDASQDEQDDSENDQIGREIVTSNSDGKLTSEEKLPDNRDGEKGESSVAEGIEQSHDGDTEQTKEDETMEGSEIQDGEICIPVDNSAEKDISVEQDDIQGASMTRTTAPDRNGMDNETSAEDDTESEEDDSEEEEDDDDDGDGDGDDDDTGDEDDEEEEEEPALKYSRLSGLSPSIFTKDAISTFIVTETFSAFATHGGVIYLMNPDMSPLRTYRAHRASILSLSSDGIYLASASIDGTIAIGSVKDQKDIHAADFKRPVHSVALDPNYRVSKSYISGGTAGKVLLSERNWLGNRTDTVLADVSESGDSISSVYWLPGNVALWMSGNGINFYSLSRRKMIVVIPRPEGSPRADLYQPRVCFPESNRIYVAWGNIIWSLKLITSPAYNDNRGLLNAGAGGMSLLSSHASVHSVALVEEKVVVEHTRMVPWLIGGISVFDHETLILLCYFPPGSGERLVSNPPEIKLYYMDTGDETYADVVALNGYERLGLNDYHLSRLPISGPKTYYVVSARDAIVATERDLNDRLEWLLARNKLKEAWEMSENILEPKEREDIGLRWVRVLISEELWDEAAVFMKIVLDEVCVKISLSKAAADWNHWAGEFIDAQKFVPLGEVLPKNVELGTLLDRSLYTLVLMYFLDHKPIGEFIELSQSFPAELYDADAMKSRLEDEIHEKTNLDRANKLRYRLAQLYLETGEQYLACQHLLALKDPSVLDVIEENHLLPMFIPAMADVLTVQLGTRHGIEHIPLDIVRAKTKRAVKLAVSLRHEVLPSQVVNELSDSDEDFGILIFLYLEELHKQDSFACSQFGDLQVKMFAEFNREELTGFLKQNNNYNLSKAVEICEKRNYIPELVYLFGRVGQNKRALELIIERLGDAEQAIEFAQVQRDRDLWNDLINYSMNKPEFIASLLTHHVLLQQEDLLRVIQEIPEGIEIPSLKDIMLQILEDNEASLSLSNGALEIIKGEAQRYSDELHKLWRAGHIVDMASGDDDRFEQVDLSESVLITPENTIVNEKDLIGERYWKTISIGPSWSITWKLKHLSYIFKNWV